MQEFKTESKKLLDLMINSIYTNQEIFLRELISNASDALDKRRFRALTDPAAAPDAPLAITVAFDKDARTITISDNGIGMDQEALHKNLGTIAHSDSLEFKTGEGAEAQHAAGKVTPADGEQQVEGADDAEAAAAPEGAAGNATGNASSPIDIIGQFGVGFYSAFMVARKVRVVSRAVGSDEAWAWECEGLDGYEVTSAQRGEAGTDVILTLKDDTPAPAGAEDMEATNYSRYLNEHTLKGLIRKYSDYVRYPIQMECSKSRALPRPEDAGDDYKTEYERYTEVETINSMQPIWKRRRADVDQDAYDEFYKSSFHDFAAPLRTISRHAEGTMTYDMLLYIPEHAPWDLYSKDYQKGLALYSSGVMIMEKCADLVPDYFNFVRGVVDSQDLQLNISRETLQHSRQLKVVAKQVERAIKSELAGMRDNAREDYLKFWEAFGRGIKFGIYSSYGMAAEQLGDLMMFRSAKLDRMVTLDEYLDGAVEGAEAAAASDEQIAEGDQAAPSAEATPIYYATGTDAAILARMPIVKAVLDRGHDVLLCCEDIDEFTLMAMMGGYKGHEFKNVAGGDLGLETEAEKTAAQEASQANADLLGAMKDALGDEVARVEVSARLGDAPVALTTEGPISLEMEKVLAMQPGAEGMNATRVLELNADHAIFGVLKAAFEAGDTQKVKRYASVLYNQALLLEGLPIADPVAFANDVCALMA